MIRTFTLLKLVVLSLFIGSASYAQKESFTCGTIDGDRPAEVAEKLQKLPQLLAKYRARTSAPETRVCRIAVDIDSETYIKYDRDTSSIISAIYRSVERASAFFGAEIGVKLVITQIRVFKDSEPDPYAGQNNIFALFNILINRNNDGTGFDKRVYFYTKTVTGGATGIAQIGGRFNVSPLEYVDTFLHELGHNFGSMHTSSCEWPGGALDYCSSVEGSCYDKALEVTGMGSFMSSCGSSYNVLPAVRAVMMDHATNTFAKVSTTPTAPTLSGDLTAARGHFYTWPASMAAQSYEINCSPVPDFAIDTTERSGYNGLYLHNMAYGGVYYVRVRAVNAFGESPWSNTARIQIDTSQPDIPRPFDAAPNSFVVANRPVTLQFAPAYGATVHQIHITSWNDVNFQYGAPETIFNGSNSYVFFPPKGGFRWRVRAVNGDKKGQWSKLSYLAANPAIHMADLFAPIPLNLENVPRTFPFMYQASYESSTHISVADNPDFKNPIFDQNYTWAGGSITDVIQNLPANSELYFRLQDRSMSFDPEYKDFKLADMTFRFKSGTDNVPQGLTYLSSVNQDVFGRSFPEMTLTSDYLWTAAVGHGFIKLNQKSLLFESFDRAGTNGMIGVGLQPSIRTDKAGNVHILSQGSNNSFWSVKLKNEVPSEEAEINRFYLYDYVNDFNPEYKLHWSAHDIWKETTNGLTFLKRFPDNKVISQLRVHENKAWIILQDGTAPFEIRVMDLNNPDDTQQIDMTNNPLLKEYPMRLEIQPDGTVWVLQSSVGNQYSLACFDGTTWKSFDANNSPFDRRIASISLSPQGAIYAMTSGRESQIWKFVNNAWEKAADPLPYFNFNMDFQVDKNEGFWLTGMYGIARLAAQDALPVKLIDFGGMVENSKVQLKWKVQEEVEMAEYVVEHSTDAKSFSPIGRTAANGQVQYGLVHTTPAPGNNYYRLKSIEVDGDFALSKMIRMLVPAAHELSVYPNPASRELEFKPAVNTIGQPGRLSVLGTDGKNLLTREIGAFREKEQIDIKNLSPGAYIIRIETSAGVTVRKVQIMK
ncbi:M12 family metallo-peptidase [Dyadobacter bucti]|uniref:M12 family metallo-peptidase n=1 Tax=Dyadobacter bucti TaxID=2572203 RepID=UPI0011081A99|nr:M12 family metallo-peptidase [Dyadobacter bucti]